MIVGITGQARSGKDTVADFICKSDNFVKYSMAGPIKAGLRAMMSFDKEYTDGPFKEIPIADLGDKSPRFMMQTLGTEWGRDIIDDNIWVTLMARKYKECLNKNVSMVIPDVRFDNEAAKIKELGGFVLLVVNPKLPQKMKHRSEAGVDVDKYVDFGIKNDGSLQDLYEKTMDVFTEKMSRFKN